MEDGIIFCLSIVFCHSQTPARNEMQTLGYVDDFLMLYILFSNLSILSQNRGSMDQRTICCNKLEIRDRAFQCVERVDSCVERVESASMERNDAMGRGIVPMERMRFCAG